MKGKILLVLQGNNGFKIFYIGRIYTCEPGYYIWWRG